MPTLDKNINDLKVLISEEEIQDKLVELAKSIESVFPNFFRIKLTLLLFLASIRISFTQFNYRFILPLRHFLKLCSTAEVMSDIGYNDI